MTIPDIVCRRISERERVHRGKSDTGRGRNCPNEREAS